MKKLVLAEKPSVARDIARVLGCTKSGNGYLEGKQYIVTWALGHLVTLADPESYQEKYKSWQLEDLPIIPEPFKLVVIKKTNKQYQSVKSQMMRKDVNEIIIATDAGREGELVARLIIEKAGVKKPLKRLWISSVTDKAIKAGFATLKAGRNYDPLYHAARARSQADWLVGINATRALTAKFNAELSCGRVQTPTLAMIAHRMDEIRQFKPVPYYGLTLKTDELIWTWKNPKDQSSRTFDASHVKDLYAQVNKQKGVISQVSTVKKKEVAPQLYDLTQLQQDANARFGYSAKETLQLAQSLYESHKVLTYPRTDSRYLTRDLVATLPDRLKAISISPYRPFAVGLLKATLNTKACVNDQKVSDHHAIIPTEETAILSQLSDRERKIFDLVVKRFLAVLSQPHVYEQTTAELTIGSEIFTTKHRRTISLGFKEIDQATNVQVAEIPALRQGDTFITKAANITTEKTTPPPYFNEGSLLGAMENPVAFLSGPEQKLAASLKATGGIGTVATRADIIDKLFNKFMIEKRNQDILLTAKGRQLLELVPTDLKSPALTGNWEQKLTAIEKKKGSEQQFIAEIKAYAKANVTAIKNSKATYKHDNLTTTKCPECDDFMLAVTGKRGKMLVCQNRTCKTRKMVSQTTNARCPNCRKKLELRGEGEKRMFSCVCGHRERLTHFEKRKKAHHNQGNKRDVANYLRQQRQQEEPINNPFADALAGLKLDE
ncbi:MAG: DNA topoisomerase III [Defluviitaleaceae bacterium]|nr:DNA topoisomerase III [Defluviitaleaceae bacterium]